MQTKLGYTVSVTMRNSGTTTWAPGSHVLGSENPVDNVTWALSRVALTTSVAPGQNHTFTFPVTAPLAGDYTMQWRMLGQGGWFGDIASSPVTVTEDLSRVTFIHTDGLGSPVARTDGAGNLISRTRYEPYGYVASGAVPTVGFTGHVNDADTGLTYMQQRYYDPVAGRFLSVDPVVTDANTGGSFNRYAYAANNPYKYIDPDGRQERAAEAFGNQFRNDAAAGNSAVYEPFHTPVVIATIGMAVGPPIAAAVIARMPTVVVGATKAGDKRVRIYKADGSVKDVTAARVKEYVPNTHPKAPPGTLDKVKFENPLPGSKGFKREPTEKELKILENAK